MFLLNSCLSLFSAATFLWHPFSRSYGVILPSSLTMLLPSALGFSPHPPVSVYGTGTVQTIAAFLDAWLTHFATILRSTSRLRIVIRILGFSPHPPVSVYGTGTVQTIAAFLDAWLTHFATILRSTSRLRIVIRICLHDSYLACTRLSIPRLCFPHVSPQFCYTAVQEFQPVVHRLRLSCGSELTRQGISLP